MKRIDAVVEYTLIRVKTNTKLTNFIKLTNTHWFLNLDQDSRRYHQVNKREIFEIENHEKLKLKLKLTKLRFEIEI